MSRLAVALTLSLTACACSKSKSSKPEPQPTAETGAPKPATKGGGAESAMPEGDGASFQLTIDAPAPVAPGGEAIARLTVVPTAGYHINQDFPTKLTLEPKEGIALAKTEFAVADAEKFDESQLIFAVKATPAASGSYQVDGKLKFAVCKGEEDCEPKRRSVSFTVAAQ